MKKFVSAIILTIASHPFLANDLPIVEYNSINHPVIDDKGMVVSQRMIASEVGAEILKKGGNAVDAAVATGRLPLQHQQHYRLFSVFRLQLHSLSFFAKQPFLYHQSQDG